MGLQVQQELDVLPFLKLEKQFTIKIKVFNRYLVKVTKLIILLGLQIDGKFFSNTSNFNACYLDHPGYKDSYFSKRL